MNAYTIHHLEKMKMQARIIEPITEDDFRNYYRLRYEVLRKPWQQPEGSEKAPDDAAAVHAMAQNDENEVVGVCRLHLDSAEEAQLRFMAVAPGQQGKGIGKQLLAYMEDKAREQGASYITLQAREEAVPFYVKNGYRVVEKSYVLFNAIQHYRMVKEL